ncbi:spore gernimation protein GerPD [Bacillus marinisedimentorum]|uniref:spore gernimation protein GerPD n=1 Tax=Bacillus marinisedimentorum TaxID=1821260 RepID=UPI000873243C|nr:spore gernimation protein GerPD [Bacillus marinisedimentorum]
MHYTVVNRELAVGDISILGVSSSSIVLVGDTESIALSSIFDTPAESLIIGPFVPLSPETGR